MLRSGLCTAFVLVALGAASGSAVASEGASEGGNATPNAATVPDSDTRRAAMIRRLVERGDEAAVEYVVRSVRAGLSPRSLEAFLEAAEQAPHADYVPLLRRLTRYRKERIRALALVALAAFDEDHGAEAALRAMEDPSLDVRLLGVSLAERFTAPHVEEAMLLLLERDPRVAEIVGRS